MSKVAIKPIKQLLKEGWERIVWGWIKYRGLQADEINYYQGIEDILDESRVLTTTQGESGHQEYLHCVETNYHVAREVVATGE